jgi:hypothetical protein
MLEHGGFEHRRPLRAFVPGTMSVTWSRPGRATPVVAGGSATFPAAGSRRPLRIRLTGYGRRLLRRAGATLKLSAAGRLAAAEPAAITGADKSPIVTVHRFVVCRRYRGCEVNPPDAGTWGRGTADPAEGRSAPRRAAGSASRASARPGRVSAGRSTRSTWASSRGVA